MFLHLHLSNLAKHDRVINCIDGSAVGRKKNLYTLYVVLNVFIVRTARCH